MPQLKSNTQTGKRTRKIVNTVLLTITILCLTLIAPFASKSAHASITHDTTGGQANFALQPVTYDPKNPLTRSYFIFNTNPGDTINSSVRVINSGTITGKVSLYPVDATTGQTSGAVYLGKTSPRQDIGSWITLSRQQLTLVPGQSQIVKYTITIPGQPRAGQHLGGIVAENITQPTSVPTANPGQNTGTFHISVKNLTIIAVQINLPGPVVQTMTTSGVQASGQNGYQQLLIGLSNTGNIMLKPSGTLKVSDAQSNVSEAFSLNLDTFLPQTSINYPVTITGPALVAGTYTATLDLAFGTGQTLHYTTTFTITQQQLTQVFSASKTQAPGALDSASSNILPWLIMGAFLVLLLIGGNIIFWKFVLARNNGNNKPPTYHNPTASQFKRQGKF